MYYLRGENGSDHNIKEFATCAIETLKQKNLPSEHCHWQASQADLLRSKTKISCFKSYVYLR